jgi:tetratricopeptide (TPR) repeat protein
VESADRYVAQRSGTMTPMDAPADRLRARFPGIGVVSEIQAHALLGEFEEGIEAYGNLTNGSSDDLRWLGVCHFSQFNDDAAIDAYRRAISSGCQAARINLAHSLAFVDRAEEIPEQLEQVNFEELGLYDKVFYLRVKSQNDERNGELQTALRQAEYAWRIVQGAPEFPLLAPHLLNQLGILHGRIGRAQRALWYLDRNLELTAGDDNVAVHLTRVRVLSTLGLLDKARQEYEALASVPDQYGAIMLVRSAEISWAEGNVDTAIDEYREAAALAKRLGQGFEEFQASLDLCVLLARFTDCDLDAPLARAQELISDRSDRLMYRFREILLFLWSGHYTSQHAADELFALSRNLNEMGLLQEQGWVDSHAACALAASGHTDRAHRVLDSLAALAVTLQNPAFLAREWLLMPEFREHVSASHPTIAQPVDGSR